MPYASELVALIDADTRRFDQKAAGVDRALKKLASSDPEVTVSVDDTAAQADIRGVEAALAGIEDQTVGISADATDARSEVQTVEAALAGIEDESVGISADAAQARGEVQTIAAALAGIEDESVAVTANAAQARAEVQTVEAALAGIEDESVVVTVEGREARAEVQTVEAALAGLEDQTVRVNVEAEELSATLAGLGTGMGGVAGSSRSMGSSIGSTAAETLALGAAVDSADGRLDMMGGRIGQVVGQVGLLKAGVVGLAGGAAATGFYKLGQGALELRDTVNATNVVFGESRSIIDDWAQNSVDRVGLSERAFRDLSAPLGALMRSLGATGSEVANMSTEVISLGADFASVLGGSTEEAVMAVGAAFRGETEPIRRYGITLDAAAVQERALAMGLVDGTGKIKNRAAVVRDLIVEQAEANGIVGDFNRTQGEGVNALREAGAALEDAKNAWGELFAPAVEAGANALRQAAEWSEKVIGPIQTVHGWLEKVDLIDLGHVTGGLQTLGGWLGIVDSQAEETAAAEAKLAIETRAASESLRDATAATRQGADGLGIYYDSIRTAEGAQRQSSEAKRDAASASRTLAGEEERAKTATDDLKSALDRLIGINLSAEEAQIRFEQSLQGVTSTLKENSHHLDGNSEKQLKSRGEVVNAAQAALSHVQALKDQGARTHEVNTALQGHRLRLIEAMVAGGTNRAEAERYIGTLGLTVGSLREASGKTLQLRDRTDELGGAATNTKGKTDELRGAVDRSGGAAWGAREAFGRFKGAVESVPNDKNVHVRTPGLHEAHVSLDAFKAKIDALKGGQVNFSLKLTQEHMNRAGDGPGNIRAAGSAMARARAAATGLPVRMTSGYRTPARNRAVGGSPTSYHMDAGNPASDWVGPTWALDELARRLRAAGGYRELLWRVPNHAPGDNPHVHYAHTGGIVDPSWATMPGLRNDERPVIAQVGETILPRDMNFRQVTHQLVDALIGGIGSGPVLANFRALGTEIARSIVTGVRQGVTAQHAVAPRPAPAPPRARHEDEPGWDWRTQGNRMRGIQDRRGFWYHEHADGHIRNTHPRSPGAPLPPRFHTGGIVGADIARSIGLRGDERLITAQVGEGILSRSDMAALASSGGSSAPVVGGGPTFNIVVNIPANAPDAATVRQMAYDAAKAGTAEAFAEERRRNLAMNGRR